MNFIIQETGEMKSIHAPVKRNYDVADEIACSCGFDPRKFAYDDEKDAFIAPESEVSFWVDFFEIYNSCDEEIYGLLDIYNTDEVNAILYSEMPEFDIDVYKNAVEETKAILQKRYDTTKARLISSHDSNTERDFYYCKESLYQRDDGSYFLAGEGGALSGYGRKDELGGMGYGEGYCSISERQAQEWLAKHHN